MLYRDFLETWHLKQWLLRVYVLVGFTVGLVLAWVNLGGLHPGLSLSGSVTLLVIMRLVDDKLSWLNKNWVAYRQDGEDYVREDLPELDSTLESGEVDSSPGGLVGDPYDPRF